MTNVFENVRALWNKEQIRILVMVSLAMQIVLIVFAPLRKRSANKKLLVLLWVAYLGADYVATLALGSILAHTMENVLGGHSDVDLVALWAPFLLLHLGGPDNITSYSLEDNELWLRHFLGLVMQVSMASMVLLLSNLQSTKILVPSVLIFIVGMIKFGERTLALRAATTEQLRHSVSKLRSFITPFMDFPRELHVKLSGGDNEMSDAEFILRCYISFRRLSAHMIGTLSKSAGIYFTRKEIDFEGIGMELSFFYGILHTKATIIHSFAGRMVRLASLVSITIALISFHISEKWNHESSDLIITYILLVMALFLEIYSVLLLVTSDLMTIVLFFKNRDWSRNLAEFISRAKNHIFPRCHKQRWSSHMGQYTLQQEWVRRIEKITIHEKDKSHMIIWIRKKLNSLKHAWHSLFEGEQTVEVSDTLEKMMSRYVGNLVQGINDYYELARKLRSSWIANTIDQYESHLRGSSEDLLGRSFEECVITWHLVTEIFYFDSMRTENPDTEQLHMSEAIYGISKYMMHLLFKRSSMMPPGIAKMTATYTFEVVKFIYFKMRKYSEGRDLRHVLSEYFLTKASSCITLEAERSVCPLTFLLWEDLTNIDNSRLPTRWQVMGDAWMEMLTFAALHCSATEHAKALSRGGELLTMHWMLLAHHGIMEEFNCQKNKRNQGVPQEDDLKEYLQRERRHSMSERNSRAGEIDQLWRSSSA